MRYLNGSELASFIKQRQLQQTRGLAQTRKVTPNLAIIIAKDDPVIDTYVRLKSRYGEDVGVKVEVHRVTQSAVPDLIGKLNDDNDVHGIILQLPISRPSETDALVNLIAPAKDVDGLGQRAKYISATATAIDWLLAGYNITLKGKEIAIVGNGRLVGAPLTKLWRGNGLSPEVYDDTTIDLSDKLKDANVIVTATGVPHLIKTDSIKHGAVVVDAGTASEGGVLVGDLDEAVYERDDLTITPRKGGVGPMTIAALFDHVITAADQASL